YATADMAGRNADIAAEAARAAAAAVERGRAAYQQAAGCPDCHMWNGAGVEGVQSMVGVALDAVAATQIIACGVPETVMRAFAPSACESQARAEDAPRILSQRDAEAIATYVVEILAKGASREECETVNGAGAAVCAGLVN
ncbi:MAG: hypothetical protein O2905_08465, partial [Proteobacteria bacterium]|nr:hypothetical protein [Pseudomonadota bacterium]